MDSVCRDCLKESRVSPAPEGERRCAHCGSPRIVTHPRLAELAIAHIDCDAFYATVEKRDRPELKDKPVVVGGRNRGVVMAACYVARLYGVRSAMPMFKALRACPDAVVVKPDMAKYREVGRQVRAMMLETTPSVEPLSIDEAFLDLNGTRLLHGGSPARTLATLVQRCERELGITASVGLSYNKFLAKIASDLDKPKGFAVIGPDEALSFLGEKPVGIIWGVGKALRARMAKEGIQRVGDLRPFEEAELVARYGAMGARLYRLCRAEDDRRVTPDAPAKSVSAETTFNQDLSQADELKKRLWPLCETVAGRLKAAGLAGRSVTLKMKTASFRLLTRSRTLTEPTRLAEELYRTALPLLEREAQGEAFRLIGIGAADLRGDELADPPDLLDPEKTHRRQVEEAMDAVRGKLGRDAIVKGRSYRGPRRD